MELIDAIELWASLLDANNPQRRILMNVIDEIKKGNKIRLTAVRYLMAQYGATTTSRNDEAIIAGMDVDDWEDERERLLKRGSA